MSKHSLQHKSTRHSRCIHTTFGKRIRSSRPTICRHSALTPRPLFSLLRTRVDTLGMLPSRLLPPTLNGSRILLELSKLFWSSRRRRTVQSRWKRSETAGDLGCRQVVLVGGSLGKRRRTRVRLNYSHATTKDNSGHETTMLCNMFLGFRSVRSKRRRFVLVDIPHRERHQ